MPELNRQLAAETYNPLYRLALRLYREQYTARVDDAFQDGHFIGQSPFRDHAAEAQALLPKVPFLIQITQMEFDPAIEPRKQRAQQMLRRYEEITNG